MNKYTINILFFLPTFALLTGCYRQAQHSYPPFNYVLGTQTFAPKYQFTDDTRLVETAKQIKAMGSNTIKLLVGSGAINDYKLPPNPEINSFTSLLDKEPSYRQVLRMPFDYYLFWVHSSPIENSKWGGYYGWSQGYSEQERYDEYQQIYDLTCYLLTEFNNTGKTFMLGNWEGDWLLMEEPYRPDKQIAPAAISGMIQRMNNRQLAVDNARKDTIYHNVAVYHYVEVRLVHRSRTEELEKFVDRNKVEILMDDYKSGLKSITTDVLPYTNVDYVSYSSYDSLFRYQNLPLSERKEKVARYLTDGLDWIDSHLPPKDNISGKRVFIGEYGFPVNKDHLTPQAQDELSRVVMKTALQWGCPFALYWQMYENESEEGGSNASGYWLIDPDGNQQPVYHTLKDFYSRACDYVKHYRQIMHRNPSQEQFRMEAVKWLDEK